MAIIQGTDPRSPYAPARGQPIRPAQPGCPDSVQLGSPATEAQQATSGLSLPTSGPSQPAAGPSLPSAVAPSEPEHRVAALPNPAPSWQPPQHEGFLLAPTGPTTSSQPKEKPPMERELKFSLPGQSGYEALAGALGQQQETLHQVNAYLVSPTSMHDKRTVLRVRQENEDYVLTCKLGDEIRQGYQESAEHEVRIDAEQAHRLMEGRASLDDWQLEPMQAFAQQFGREPLSLQGKMSNLRRTFPLPNGDTAELDRTSLPNGRTDFELEVETERPEEVKEYLQGLFDRAGVPMVAQTKGKYRRFLESLGLAGQG